MLARTAMSLLLILAGTEATAQLATDSVDHTSGHWLVGGSVGVPGYRAQAAPAFFTIGMNFTRVEAGRLGADFSLGTMPRAFAEGVGVVGFRGGVALPIALAPEVLLLPSAGASLVAAGGGEGGGALAGVNAGAAFVLGKESLKLRTGVTWHHFQGAGGAIWLVEFGLVRLN